jgi:uncharacterized membrane protein
VQRIEKEYYLEENMKEKWNLLSVYQKTLLVALILFMITTDVLMFCFDKMLLGVACLAITATVGLLLYRSCK